ncbi:MAG: hypothetical protein ACI37R_00765 [Candidatus Avigastranaerophilus sp.]
MNIKARLDNPKRKSVRAVKVKNDNFVNEIFSSNEAADTLITQIVNSSKNILFISGIDCDNSIIAAYIKNHITEKSVCCLDNLDKDTDFSKYSRIIISSGGIKGLVKVFEAALNGYEGFTAGVDLKSYENVLENLKTLILINYPNLSVQRADNLIMNANPVLIFFDKDDDGLFRIKSIDDVVKVDNVLCLKNLFSEFEKVPADETTDTSSKEDVPCSENAATVIADNTPEIKKPSSKINKYKLLKEKIKSKK